MEEIFGAGLLGSLLGQVVFGLGAVGRAAWLRHTDERFANLPDPFSPKITERWRYSAMAIFDSSEDFVLRRALRLSRLSVAAFLLLCLSVPVAIGVQHAPSTR